MQGSAGIARLLQARSVAVIGASADPLKVGGRPIDYLHRFGFTGRIVPVNPTRDEVQGLRCYRSISDIGPVDLAIISTPAAAAREALEQCLAAGIKALILFTAGYAEVDSQGRAAQAALAKAACDAGAFLLGPNCLGAINARTRLVASFTTALEELPLPEGSFSYFGQSGALGAYWIEKVVSGRLGIAKWITTGNEAQLTLADALSYLASDAESRVIGAYIEDIKQPTVFAEAAAAARAAGKTILAIKGGRSPAGRRAAAAHTGADAREDDGYDTLLADCGIRRVTSLTEMVDTARLILSSKAPTRATRLGVVTVSGGAGVLICDAAHEAGLSVPPLSAAVRTRLDGLLPAFVQRQNPVDVTGAVVSNARMLAGAVTALGESDDCDVIVLFYGAMGSIRDALVAAVRTAAACGKPVVVIWMGAPADARAAIEEMRIPVFPDIPPAIAALANAIHGCGGGPRGAHA